MLQLLLERGQSYEDIGSLLGLGVDDVRARARSALTEMAGEDPDADVGLTDYLLGQADPIGRADAARHLQADPEANALAAKLEAQLRLLAPSAELPDLPQARAQRQPRAEPPGQTKKETPAAVSGSGDAAAPAVGSTSLDSRQRRLIAALLAGGVLVAVIVLIATGAFGGGGDQSSTTGSGQTAKTNKVTKALLLPVGGANGRAVALFGQVKGTPVIQLTAIGLDQPAKGEAYYAWLTNSQDLDLPIGGFPVDGKGRAVAQIKVPTQALELVANETFTSMQITRTNNSEYQAAVKAAAKQKTFPPLTGTSILSGEITGPIVGAAKATAATGQTGATGG